MADYFSNFFDTADFPPRWHCGNWSEFLGWLHIVSDIATFAAYFAIPVVLVYFARKRRDFPALKLFWLFAAFIFACGSVHLIEAIIFWHPIYRVSGAMKFVTAITSWATVLTLVRYAPSLIALPSIVATNEKLKSEVTRRETAEHELKQANENLLRRTKELELLYQTAPIGMSLIGRDRKYVRINEYLADINGHPVEDHAGRTIDELLPDLSPIVWPIYEKVFSTGQSTLNLEVVGKTPASDQERIWDASYHPLKNDSGLTWAVSSIVQEITDRKRYEADLQTAKQQALQANQSKSEFLANMSHEIRTPMAAILGYADVLLGHLQDPDNRNCVLVMKRNGQFLLELINDILDLSRIEAGKMDVEMEPCELAQLVSDIDSLMFVRASEKRIELSAEFTTAVPARVMTDATRLRQVLINLIGNAIKFTESGTVSLKVGIHDGRLEFAIHDTGIGMTQEQQERLFKPFSQGDSSVTRQYGGSGLGLAISRRLIKILGGEIMVESQAGNGSTFRVSLPIETSDGEPWVKPKIEHEVDDRVVEPQPLRTLDCRVLVIDDRRDVRHISQHFLEKAGARVSTGENGRQGFDAAIAASEEGQPFEVIVMDMQMPVVDGLQATAELRTAGIETPIIALTADAMKGDREKCLNGGCDDYLSKPIDHLLLVNMVARYTRDVSLDDLRLRRQERIASLRATLSNSVPRKDATNDR